MSRNGVGVYTLPANSFNPAVSGAAPTASDWNTTKADIETAMSASIANDGQTVCTAAIPFAAGISAKGTTTNDNAAAGYLGEYASASRAEADLISLTTATEANIITLALTAGDWDVAGIVYYKPGGATVITATTQGINTTSATIPPAPNAGRTEGGPNSTGLRVAYSVGPARFSLGASATVYLVGYAVFSASTLGGFGAIWARRVR